MPRLRSDTGHPGATTQASSGPKDGCADEFFPKLAAISDANDPDHPLIISDEERANAVLALLAKGGIELH